MKNLLLSIVYRKSKLYRFLFVLCICCFSVIVFFIAKNAQNLEPPLGLFSNKNNQVLVTLSTEKMHMLPVEKFQVGTPIYLLDENLVLIGYIAAKQAIVRIYFFL